MLKKIIFIFLILFSSNLIFGKVLFNETFENGFSTNPNPIWKWANEYNPLTGAGKPYGEGDLYWLSDEQFHSGNYSFKMRFDGRNNWCNICGTMGGTYKMASGHSGSNYYEDENSSLDFNNIFYNLTNPYAIVFNKNDYFSKWEVESIVGNKIYFKNNIPVSNEMNGEGLFDSGDEIKIPRVCGLHDLTYGGNIGMSGGEPIYDRRLDCNIAIGYLGDLNRALDLPYNGTLAFRFYLYFSDNIVLDGGMKLSYADFKTESGLKSQMIPVMNNHLGNELFFNFIGGRAFPTYFDPGINFKENTWYYFEEVFKRESSNTSNDGTFDFYFAESGQPVSAPIYSLSNLNFGKINALSVMGNWGRKSDASGDIFIDDVMVSQERIGPVDGNFLIPAPKPILSIDTTNIDFGSVPQGFNRTQVLFLENIGTGPVTINNLDYVGDFDYESFCPTILDVGITCELHFTFTNMGVGSYSGELNISSNGNNSDFYSVPIIGERNNLQLDDLILSYWNFDDYSSTKVFGNSKYKINGNIFGTPLFENFNPVSDLTGNYISLDGIDDTVIYENKTHFNLNNSFTISMWVYPKNNSLFYLFSKAGPKYSYGLTNQRFGVSSTGGYPVHDNYVEYSLDLNKWQYVSGVYDEKNLFVYIDGKLVGQSPYIGDGVYQYDVLKLHLGSRDDYDKYFNGYIDEVKVYNFSLTGGDIYSQYLKDLNLSINITIPIINSTNTSNTTTSVCPNNIIESGESCDGSDLNSQTCMTLGYDKGTLSCLSSCLAFNESSCSMNETLPPPSKNQTCNNNITEGTESCDGPDLNGKTCSSFKEYKTGGTLACTNSCQYNLDSCILDDVDSGSGGSGGGGRSSTFSVSQIQNINLTNVCIPDYKYYEWSECQDGFQTQFVEDLNFCDGDILEKRSCKLELSEEENLLLNAKKITLDNFAKKKYKAPLEKGYNEIIYTDEKVEDSIFLFQDESSGEEYYGQYYDSVADKHYYTLKRVDEGFITILQDEGIIGGDLYETAQKLNKNGLLYKILIGVKVILFFAVLISAYLYIKKIKKNKESLE